MNDKNVSCAVKEPRILLPKNCDMRKWSVVACDQFTSDGEYWSSLDSFVGSSPSTLRLILPEHYLGHADADSRRAAVSENMLSYYKDGLFCEKSCFVLVKRTFASGKVRTGLVAAADLEQYDFRKGSAPRIIATEGTVEDRLPPRVQIRENSLLELPHIMLLIDDPDNTVFSAVERAAGEMLYDFDLNCGGGHISGRSVADADSVIRAFEILSAETEKRFGKNISMLVGDGNHSLAAAKLCYEKAKAEGDPTAVSKRYALCEIVNLYDEGIEFEPIHRAVFGADASEIAARLRKRSVKNGVSATVRGGGKEYPFTMPSDPIEAVAFVQNFLQTDDLVSSCEVDYIHGIDALKKIGDMPDCSTIMLPAISKSCFTEYILNNGTLPKKTFSMGHAEEKRYYLEARLIGLPDKQERL